MGTAGQVGTARQQFAAHGAAALWVQPWSGVPFKVWAIVGGVRGIAPWPAVPIFIVARALRMTIVATLARLLAARYANFARDYFLVLAAAYLLVFSYGWRRVQKWSASPRSRWGEQR
jgi:hypothetical protein